MSTAVSSQKKYRRGKATKQEARAAKLFLIPAFLGLSLITYIPLASVFGISLFSWRVPGTPSFAGFDNYRFLFRDELGFFWPAIRHTLQYALLAVVISLIFSMCIALLLNRKLPGRAAFRTIFYMPFIIPAVATFMTFRLIYDGSGVLNSIWTALGGTRVQFLANPSTIIPALAMIAVWTSGNLIVIKMAGLGNVPRVYQEAAEIDGANAWYRFWHITIPCMTPIIFYNVLMSLVTNMQVFVPSLIMTQGGGSGIGVMHEQYNLMAFILYREGFMRGQMGRASAISFILFVMIGVFTAILFATSKKWLFYEGGDPK